MLGDTLLTLTFAVAFGFLTTLIGNVLEAKKPRKGAVMSASNSEISNIFLLQWKSL